MRKTTLAVCTFVISLVYMIGTMILSDYHVAQVIAKYHLPKDIFGEESGYSIQELETEYKNFQITYGEILPPGIANMHALAQKHKISRFIDLGSGTGKTVLVARMMGFERAEGIEIVRSRHYIAMNSLQKLPSAYKTGITFIHGDAFQYTFERDVPLMIFMSNLVWDQQSIRNLFHHIALSCAPGTLVISSYCYMHPDDEKNYTYLGTVNTPMTWNYFSYCYIHMLGKK